MGALGVAAVKAVVLAIAFCGSCIYYFSGDYQSAIWLILLAILMK